MSGTESQSRADALQENLRQFIAENGLKSSKQRDVIAEVFFTSGGHLSVEDLIQLVREVEPKVSQATVYRTMNLLKECGLAETRNFFDGQTLYEIADSVEDHHDHLICVDCGRIIEFVDASIEERQERVAEEQGFALVNHRMNLYGHCKELKATNACPHKERDGAQPLPPIPMRPRNG